MQCQLLRLVNINSKVAIIFPLKRSIFYLIENIMLFVWNTEKSLNNGQYMCVCIKTRKLFWMTKLSAVRLTEKCPWKLDVHMKLEVAERIRRHTENWMGWHTQFARVDQLSRVFKFNFLAVKKHYKSHAFDALF